MHRKKYEWVLFKPQETEDKWKGHIDSYLNINEYMIYLLRAQEARQSLRRMSEKPLIPLILETIQF